MMGETVSQKTDKNTQKSSMKSSLSVPHPMATPQPGKISEPVDARLSQTPEMSAAPVMIGNQTSSFSLTQTSNSIGAKDILPNAKKFEEFLSKRGPVIIPTPAQHISAQRKHILQTSVENLKKKGNKEALDQLQEYDAKFNLFLQKAAEIKTKASSVSPSASASVQQNPSPNRVSPSTFLKKPSYAALLQIPPFNPAKSKAATKAGHDQIKVSVQTPPSNSNSAANSPTREYLVDPDDFPFMQTWQVYYDRKQPGGQPNNNQNYENTLMRVCNFVAIKQFWRCYNHIKKPSDLEVQSTLHVFKDGIKPMWEDPRNSKGGKWTLGFQNCPDLLDQTWELILLSMVGETLFDGAEICGLVLSRRSKGDRISLWVRDGKDERKLLILGKRVVEVCDLINKPITMDFSLHEESLNLSHSHGKHHVKQLTMDNIRSFIMAKK